MPRAGVRKPPKEETAMGERLPVRQALRGIERQPQIQCRVILNRCRRRVRAQLGRYGMNVAKWGFEVSRRL